MSSLLTLLLVGLLEGALSETDGYERKEGKGKGKGKNGQHESQGSRVHFKCIMW